MREIRFRCWYKEYNTMMYEDDVATINDIINIGKENDALMQFTGLKDKNGKEIYEGDILNCTRMTDTTIGYYDQDPNTGEAVAKHLIQWDNQFAWFTIPDQIESWEVIGNIYESPDLRNVT